MFDWKMQENEVMNSRLLPNHKLRLCSVVSPFQIVLVLSSNLNDIFTFSNKFKLLLLLLSFYHCHYFTTVIISVQNLSMIRFDFFVQSLSS